jgi:fused signal recognition particle receptor
MPALSGVPFVVVCHLLAGFLSVWFLNRALWVISPLAAPRASSPVLLTLTRIVEILLLVTVFLGGWVSAMGAGLACPDFPTCRGEFIPEANFAVLIQGLLNPWADPRALLAPGSLSALHLLHRWGGGLVAVMMILLGFGLTSNPKVPALSRLGLILQILVFFLVATVVTWVQRHLPVSLGVLHVLWALLLLGVIGRIGLGLAQAPSPAKEKAEQRIVPEPESPAAEPVAGRLRRQLGKTRSGFMGFLSGRGSVDAAFMEDLEAQLLMADLGVATTEAVMTQLKDLTHRDGIDDLREIRSRLREHLRSLVLPVSQPLVIPEDQRPFVILVVGVNGVGKTTTIGKLAKRFQQQGLSVMLAAGDTFRAAAVEQLQVWGERNHVPVVAQHTGADSASVIFDALEAARARKVDVLIADTAGRLHNKSNLMEELGKVKRIMGRLDPTAPHETLLVLDGSTGQNAINQAKQFHEAVGLTGLVLTKLDGTAKGGVLFALARQFGLPIRYIGIGEGVDDLRDFDAEDFIAAIFDDD